jgi:hypothetical protein
MAEPHGLHGVDDHFLMKYRELLDAEDAAFDELEHAYEDGDREHFEMDFVAWQTAVEKRSTYLERHGFTSAHLAAV